MISLGEFILLSLIVLSAVLATVYLNRKLKEKGYINKKMLIEMSRSGESAEKMRNFRDKANEILGKRGIKPLAVPPFVRESMNEL